MKVVLNSLTGLDHSERQLIYDALYIYLQHCNKHANSQHVAAKAFARLEKKTEEMIIDVRAAWPDLLH